MGPVTRPVYLDDGLPWRRSDWPEALNGTSTAILGVDYGQLAAAINPYFDRPDLGNSTANATGMRAVVVVHQVRGSFAPLGSSLKVAAVCCK